MTSQIALLNSDGVAVASDSAVTVGDRTYSATKIYQLAGRQPVGFMTAGTASYRGISFSNIFGQFRAHFAAKHPYNAELPHLIDYVNEFRQFLVVFPGSQESPLTTCKNMTLEEKEDLTRELLDYPRTIFKSLQAMNEWDSLILKKEDFLDIDSWRYKFDTDILISDSLGLDDTIRSKLTENLRDEIIDYHQNNLTRDENWPSIKKNMSQQFSSIVNPIIDTFVSYHSLPKTVVKPLLREIFYAYLSDDTNIHHPTLISVFGFGKEENTPSLVGLRVGRWRPSVDCTMIVDHNSVSTLNKHWGRITKEDGVTKSCAFMCTMAMTNEINAILDGIHPDSLRAISKDISASMDEFIQTPLCTVKGVGKELLNRITQEIESERARHFFNMKGRAILQRNTRRNRFRMIASTLPIDELANFAETLIGLESAITHLGRPVRWVGGHTDVATITKEDGFLWVKSENRVDYGLNPRQEVAQRDSASLK
ncbi:MAG: hypothetical protein HOE69_00080 [Euryarchaeota archaeon]|jgi:hypothetical protein|nr:hypothetical protein [Euryarchaeota archaeon]